MATKTRTTKRPTGARRAGNPRSRPTGATASLIPDTGGLAEWMQNWLDPKTYGDIGLAGPTTTMQKSAIDVWQDAAVSSTAFMRDRLEKDFATLRSLTEAHDAATYIRVGTEFWQTAWNDYRDQMMRMGDQMLELADDTEEFICEASDEATKVARKAIDE